MSGADVWVVLHSERDPWIDTNAPEVTVVGVYSSKDEADRVCRGQDDDGGSFTTVEQAVLDPEDEEDEA